MVNNGIKEGRIVRDKDEAFLACQVSADRKPRLRIQVVRGLVNQEEIPFAGEEHREHYFRALAKGEFAERTVEVLCVKVEFVHLAEYAPLLTGGLPLLEKS